MRMRASSGEHNPPTRPSTYSPISGAGQSDQQHTTQWRSIYVATFLSFSGSVQFSLYFSSLWPFLQLIDGTGTERFFGYIVAFYSVGQILGSPAMGYWSNRVKRIRPPLLLGLTLMLLGNLLYLSVEFWPMTVVEWRGRLTLTRKFLLLVGRFITGVGSANSSLLKAYASTASVSADRSRAIAFVTGGQALGLTMGPGFQLLFTPIGYPGQLLYALTGGGDQTRRGFWISMYTAPAYMACAINIIGAAAVLFAFHEHYAGLDEHESDERKETECENSRLRPYDKSAIGVCYLTRFTQMFIQTNLETIGAPMAAAMFAWSRANVVFYTALAQGMMGLISFVVYLLFIAMKLDRV